MERKKILTVLQEILRDVFADESIIIDEETSANDIEGWDSLAHITILESVQAEYGIVFQLDEIIEMATIGDMADAILSKIS